MDESRKEIHYSREEEGIFGEVSLIIASIKVLKFFRSDLNYFAFFHLKRPGRLLYCSGVFGSCLCKSIDLYWELSQECLTKAEEFMCSVCWLCDFLAALPLVGCETVLVTRSYGY